MYEINPVSGRKNNHKKLRHFTRLIQPSTTSQMIWALKQF